MSADITKCPLGTKSALVEDQIGEMKKRTPANFCTVNIQTKAELGLQLALLNFRAYGMSVKLMNK